MPDLLRNWHLGSKARRYLSRRRFLAVTGSLPSGAGKRALDAGCGWGYNLFLLAARGYRPFGIDVVQNDFPAARAISSANGYESPIAGADMSALPFVSSSFDAITAVETIEHIYEPDRVSALHEAARVLTPGGAFALSTPNYYSIVETGKRFLVRFPALKRFFPGMCYPAGEVKREEYHPYRYHKPVRPSELTAALEEAGFKVVRMTRIIFIWKNVPDLLFPLVQPVEWILESIPLVRNLASTIVVLAKKVS
jgi:2-polyprenyl-3-methyl-5-hydroxy-6-metoxy-1,4-benzoquinol methylase